LRGAGGKWGPELQVFTKKHAGRGVTESGGNGQDGRGFSPGEWGSAEDGSAHILMKETQGTRISTWEEEDKPEVDATKLGMGRVQTIEKRTGGTGESADLLCGVCREVKYIYLTVFSRERKIELIKNTST